jgi:hypothetical protein
MFQGMEELIKQAFLHVDVLGEHVREGHYDLVGPDGEIILPQVWETMVQADWTITMHMWPLPEPPKSPLQLPPPLDHDNQLTAHPPSPPQSPPSSIADDTTSKVAGDVEEDCFLPVS